MENQNGRIEKIDISSRECFNNDKIKTLENHKSLDTIHQMMNSTSISLHNKNFNQRDKVSEGTEMQIGEREHFALKKWIENLFSFSRSRIKKKIAPSLAHLASRNRTPDEISSGFKGISSKVSVVFGRP